MKLPGRGYLAAFCGPGARVPGVKLVLGVILVFS